MQQLGNKHAATADTQEVNDLIRLKIHIGVLARLYSEVEVTLL